MKVLAEKLNLLDVDKSAMTGQQKASACYKTCMNKYTKEFTLEFSRDRKSMSVYCRPKEGDPNPIMFVKVKYKFSVAICIIFRSNFFCVCILRK